MAPSVLEWTVDDVSQWLEDHNHYYVHEFHEQLIDGKALLLLTEKDLQMLLKYNTVSFPNKILLTEFLLLYFIIAFLFQ